MKYQLSEIDKAAKFVLASAKAKTLLFNAPMGSGKTTLIAAICKQLGVVEKISSPTFSIINEYVILDTKIYHFDLYRIDSIDELHDIGVEEYLDSGAWMFIEWPEIVLPLLDDYQQFEIHVLGDIFREIRVSDAVKR